MISNQKNNVHFLVSVPRLERLLDRCVGSEEYVAVIRALVATRDVAAVDVLASLLDSTGPSPRSRSPAS